MAEQCSVALRLEPNDEDTSQPTGKDTSESSKEEACAQTKTVMPSPEQLEEWSALHREASLALAERRVTLARAPTGPTRSCFQHGRDHGPCVSFALDHILFSSASLRLSALWATLEADPESLATGLPNLKCPSDHLPIGAAFAVAESEGVGAGRGAELAARVGEVEGRQAGALRELRERMDAEAEHMVAKGAEEAGGKESGGEGEGGGGKGGKGKGRPSPEMVEQLQRRRRLEKELKTAQRTERGEFVGSLSIPELEHVDALVVAAPGAQKLLTKAGKGQAPATVWVEHGPAGQYT